MNYDNLDFFSFPIKAHNDSTGAVLFDASSFVLKENRFFPVIAKNVGSYSVNASLKENLTRVTKLKVFDTNACVGMDRHYIISLSGKKGSPITNYPVTIGVNFTLALLPNDLMTPRLSDTRVGMFLMNKDVLKKDGSIDKATFVKRWRLIPRIRLLTLLVNYANRLSLSSIMSRTRSLLFGNKLLKQVFYGGIRPREDWF